MNRNWKNISVPECFGIIICSLVCCLVAVIPFSFDPMTLSFTKFPLIASEEESILLTFEEINQIGLPKILPIFEDYLDLFNSLYEIAIEGYFLIVIINIVASILLMLTQSKGLRIIFRVFSVIFGIFTIFVAILFALYLVSIAMAFGELGLTFNDIINNYAGLYALAMIIFGIVFGSKQLRWFKAPFTF